MQIQKSNPNSKDFFQRHDKMACYSEKLKVLYIHIPKTGGTTIENILIDLYDFKRVTFEYGSYDFVRDIRSRMGFYRYMMLYSNEAKIIDFSSYYKFTFVRHPHSRLMSAIKFICKIKSDFGDTVPDNLLELYEEAEKNPFMYNHMIITQRQCIEDFDNCISMDYIGRYENFIDDLKHVLHDILKLPKRNIQMYHLNKSNSDIELDQNDVALLSNEIHQEDFSTFDYSLI